MKPFFRSLALAAALAPFTLMPGSASAVEYSQLQPAASKVGFQYQQLGVKLDGHFKKFSSDIRFDPAKPESARAALEVDLGSVDAGSADADSELVKPEWFNLPKFPSARFEASSITPKGEGNYEIAGKLTIKGQSKDISFPATFKGDGKVGAFAGSLTIKRNDFKIGEGEWASSEIVADEVKVSFDLKVAAQ
ncbi:MAG: YceI family protein [Lautropia sp.]|nr:YceI family protein [Lautropia sp.]